MRVLPTQGLRLNTKHPDAAGCFFAMPVMERGGEVVRDLVMRSGLGQPVWTGTRAFVNTVSGRAVSLDGSTSWPATPSTGQPWSDHFTAVARIVSTTLTTDSRTFIQCGGFLFAVNLTTGALVLADSTAGFGSQIVSTLVVPTSGEHVVGVRWRRSDGNVTFFLDGQKQDVAGHALTASAVKIALNRIATSTGIVGSARDVRIWNRYMPDATLLRYYYNPNAFYAPSRAAFRVAGFNGGRFFPFLHPALQS